MEEVRRKRLHISVYLKMTYRSNYSRDICLIKLINYMNFNKYLSNYIKSFIISVY
jgi:hypothetical protein